MRPRYYVRTLRPHVWGVMRRHDDNLPGDATPCSDKDALIESFGARGRGDRAARSAAQSRCADLNDPDNLED